MWRKEFHTVAARCVDERRIFLRMFSRKHIEQEEEEEEKMKAFYMALMYYS